MPKGGLVAPSHGRLDGGVAVKSRWLLAIVSVALLGVAAFAISHSVSARWRLQLYVAKAMGDLGELTWYELFSMTAGRDKFGLSAGYQQGRSVQAVLTNPYTSDADKRAGADIFRERCSACHGNDGGGGHGAASLLRENYSHGDTDLAIYKVVRDGVPSTAMVPTGLTETQRWQVISHLRQLQVTAKNNAASRQEARGRLELASDSLLDAHADAAEWRTYSRTYDGWRYSPLKQITTSNAAHLQLKWAWQLGGEPGPMEATPIVVGNTILISQSPSNVVALDAETGEFLWKYQRDLPTDLRVCCGWVNRGVALLGDQVFIGTLDAHLVALDANTGKVRWDTKVADFTDGYSITAAPMAIGDAVIIGVAGGEYGIRGFVSAFDAATGTLRWKFETIPGPGRPGHETWENDAWQTGGGATWVTGSYDPELKLLYWGVGNPGPDYQGAARPGDNLYTNSVVALQADSGELAWHFQFTPNDEHDWDANQTPILLDREVDGKQRKLLLTANRNGFYYVLDRSSGEYLRSMPFVQQTWAKGIDQNGRPILEDLGRVSTTGTLIFPGVGGGTNWQPPAFDPTLDLFFVHANEQGSVFTQTEDRDVKPGHNGLFVGSGAALAGDVTPIVRALDATTGKQRWEHRSPKAKNPAAASYSGLLATAGGLVFGASGGAIFALDNRDGRQIWSVPLGARTLAPPVSFEIGERQAIAILAGQALFVFALADSPTGANIDSVVTRPALTQLKP